MLEARGELRAPVRSEDERPDRGDLRRDRRAPSTRTGRPPRAGGPPAAPATEAPREQREQHARRRAIPVQGADHRAHDPTGELRRRQHAERGRRHQQREAGPRADPAAEQQPQEAAKADLAQGAPGAGHRAESIAARGRRGREAPAPRGIRQIRFAERDLLAHGGAARAQKVLKPRQPAPMSTPDLSRIWGGEARTGRPGTARFRGALLWAAAAAQAAGGAPSGSSVSGSSASDCSRRAAAGSA